MGSRSRGELGATSPRAARCHTLGWRQLACRARRGHEAFAECPTPAIPERGEEGSAALTLTQAAATPRLSGTAPGSGRIPGDAEGETWHPMGGLQRLLHPGEMRGAPAQGRLSQRCCPHRPRSGRVGNLDVGFVSPAHLRMEHSFLFTGPLPVAGSQLGAGALVSWGHLAFIRTCCY